MPEEKIEIINIRLPDKIISMLDSLVDEGLFNSRSEAVREFSREYIEEES
ncbi:ribbon-helix-helix protein, CopG family [Candidatus Woesearchaeota archaeon]|nr:ribbon-helix-helix protein, CopG family [Candidatus Woesearchaeota archaeon]